MGVHGTTAVIRSWAKHKYFGVKGGWSWSKVITIFLKLFFTFLKLSNFFKNTPTYFLSETKYHNFPDYFFGGITLSKLCLK